MKFFIIFFILKSLHELNFEISLISLYAQIVIANNIRKNAAS